MANRTFKREKNTCLTLLVLSFLAGSGIWLKLILSDVLAYQVDYELLYEREFNKRFHSAYSDTFVARGLTIEADFDACEIKKPKKDGTRRLDPADRSDGLEPEGEEPEYGDVDVEHPGVDSQDVLFHDDDLHLTASNSTKPENYCDVDTVRVKVKATLQTISKPIGPLYLLLYFSHDWERWWQANKVLVDKSLFTIDPDADGVHVACDDAVDSSCVGGKRQTTPVSVETWACVGTPAYNYLVGCVHEGWPTTTVNDPASPPFQNCVALHGICGPTCGSAVAEPTFNDPSHDETFHDEVSMHCVDPDDLHPTIPIAESLPNKEDRGLPGFQALELWKDLPETGRKAPKAHRQGVIRLDDIEAFEIEHIGLEPASYIFAIM
jgi:hypothetical protein